ncbi:type VI secretion system-associated protein [Pandoraea cepalis]|uniref:Type VI secretion system-associated protein n=1 Tax=Pandoraea cepalis TaxID=2508294 RepID=A0A5E4W0D7_9BURK|nr:type VI secretion system baseplate subunit TssK [Pandoraea cepalis]VVE17014.1 type VI secretion system-associated protein [Pandoraea cepalis]
MRIEKPLWQEGVILAPQHFQQQERWTRFSLQQMVSEVLSAPWGTLDVDIDEQALAAGRLKLNRLKLRFPDGTPVDTTLADALPAARDLTHGTAPDVQSLTVLAALALPDANGSNSQLDTTATSRPRRSYREYVKVIDEFGTEAVEIAVERHAVRLLFDFEPHADDTVCVIARLTRAASGRLHVDRDFVPPCLALSGHARHIERMQRIADILHAKSLALGTRRGERADQVIEYGVADVQLFWLLHCIHQAWPQLRHFARYPHRPTESLYLMLAQLTSTLMTFSTRAKLTDIPEYDHVRADEVFAVLETTLRDLLDTIIPSRVIPIGLARKTATTWAGQILDERIVDGSVDWYVSVSAVATTSALAQQFPRLCKIGAPDDVERIVTSALPGIPLTAVQRVPSAMPVRMDNHYFALDGASDALARMLAVRACQIYLPMSLAEASVELYAVLRS